MENVIISGNTLRDRTIEYLLNTNGVVANEIQDYLHDAGSVPTSTMYKILNKLIDGNIVVKQGRLFYLNEEWRNQIISQFSKANNKVLQEGERLTYKLNSVYEIDRHWKHYAYQIKNEVIDKKVYYFNPHQFWLYLSGREISETSYQDVLIQDGFKVYHSIGGNSVWDKQFYTIYRTNNYRINIGVKGMDFKNTDNISIFGDYIVNTKITAGLYQNIHNAYQNSEAESELIQSINLAAQNSPCRFILERNKKKAAKWRHLLDKDFA